MTTKPNATTLDELLNALRAEEPNAQGDTEIDWTDLPTFGGEEPGDTGGIWSWDETRLLIGASVDELRIVSRREFFERPDEIALLRSVIDASGLSARRFATEVLSRDERTCRRWIAGDSPIPRAVINFLRAYLTTHELPTTALADKLGHAPKHKTPTLRAIPSEDPTP